MIPPGASPGAPPDAPAGDAAIAGCGPLLRSISDATRPLRQQIFEHIRAQGIATRAEITRALNVSAASVTQLTADLIGRGLLEEVEDSAREATRGRPPTALRVVPGAGRVIGLRLGDVANTAVLTDFAGNELGTVATPTRPHKRRLSEAVTEVESVVGRALDDAGLDRGCIDAVGLGVAGLVDHPSGTLAWSPFMAGRNVALKAALEDRLGLRVHVDNDVNVLSLAELWFGAGRAMSDFAVVTIEQGVGMGLVLGNRLYRGSRGMGLELGHTKVQLDGALCRCGQRGCLEAYIADYALVREAATALDRPFQNLQSPQDTLDALYREAKGGDAGAQEIFHRAGRYLALGLSNVVQLFDPELIVLSGARMQFDYLYADEVLAEMQALTLDDGRPPCRVEIHAWGDLVWARGAAALALEAETDRVLGQDWAP